MATKRDVSSGSVPPPPPPPTTTTAASADSSAHVAAELLSLPKRNKKKIKKRSIYRSRSKRAQTDELSDDDATAQESVADLSSSLQLADTDNVVVPSAYAAPLIVSSPEGTTNNSKKPREHGQSNEGKRPGAEPSADEAASATPLDDDNAATPQSDIPATSPNHGFAAIPISQLDADTARYADVWVAYGWRINTLKRSILREHWIDCARKSFEELAIRSRIEVENAEQTGDASLLADAKQRLALAEKDLEESIHQARRITRARRLDEALVIETRTKIEMTLFYEQQADYMTRGIETCILQLPDSPATIQLKALKHQRRAIARRNLLEAIQLTDEERQLIEDNQLRFDEQEAEYNGLSRELFPSEME